MSPSEPASQVGPQTNETVGETPSSEVARLKRRVAQLQEEVDVVNSARQARSKKKISSSAMGRGIRRLAAMFGSLVSLVLEADRRSLEAESDRDSLSEEEMTDRDRAYKGFAIMVDLVPALRTLLNDGDSEPEDLDKLTALLQEGANDARGDDIRSIKAAIANWLNKSHSPAIPFSTTSRDGRGFQNDITGALLCPVEYDWNNEATRLAIKAGTLVIKEDLYLSCFYPRGKGNPDNVEEKFLQSRLLVQTYCAIFTSPTSAEAFDEEETEDGPVKKKGKTSASQKKATKSNVATILHMNGVVTPRSIAYAAVLLAFNLTDAVQWVEQYNNFSYRALWEFIVDFFEAPAEDDDDTKKVQDLLAWWNRQVFPQHTATTTNSRKARNKLKLQRSQRRARASSISQI
ncbi:hypothetical protein BJ165DRAFT_1527721 [Panaeolus papilionaceus]|nr:hypothetical protein BJ165DRAFT_1527721 [Panaeolus papilionaceus]